MPKIARPLTAIEVSRLKVAGFVSVGDPAGLSLQITPNGVRSWVLRVKVGSKRRDMGLGAYPGVTLAQARDKARAARALVEQGHDPILERQQAASRLIAAQAKVITFKSATVSFIKTKSMEWTNPKHVKQWEATMAEYAYPHIGDMHVGDIELPHVLAVLEPIWMTKTETANRVRGRIENVLDWAKASGHRIGDNPACWRGLLDKVLPAPSKVAKVVHHPAIPVDEVAAFYADLRTRDGMAARALEFKMLTAVRSGEVRGAVWSEIDLTKAVWTIPAERMKANKEHRVPLSTKAVDLLGQLPKLDESPFVFYAPRSGQLSDMALTQVMRRMGSTAVPHGMRSTFRDWCGDRTNFPRDLAEMALAHTLSSEVEAAYRRSDMLERRRRMMESWAEFLVKRKSASAVVDLHNKAKAA